MFEDEVVSMARVVLASVFLAAATAAAVAVYGHGDSGEELSEAKRIELRPVFFPGWSLLARRCS